MAFKYCFLFPVIQGILYPVTFITTYLLSVSNEDIPAVFPYVSDTGAWSLERCIFSFMLGFGCLLMFLTLYIRYRQVKEILERGGQEKLKVKLSGMHRASLYLAVISVVGLFTLGCFQVQPFLVLHSIGAFAAFGAGLVILVIQTHISFKIYPLLGNRGLNIFRAVVVGIVAIALILTAVFGALSFIRFKGDDITQWTENCGGYDFHLVSTASEWVLIFGVVLYLTLYAIEFKSIVIYKPKIKLTEEV